MLPQLISLFGPDGSGKSTHVQILVDDLEAQGLRVKKIWIRSPHTLAFVVSKLLVRLGFYRVATNPAGMTVKMPAVNRNQVIRRIWAFIEFLSVLPIILLRMCLPLKFGYTLVSDRSLVDTVVTIAYFIGDKKFIDGRTARLLLRFIPKHSIFIYLDSDYVAISARRGKIVEPKEFIEFQRAGYKKLSKIINAEIIDTSDLSIARTSERISNTISRGFKAGISEYLTNTHANKLINEDKETGYPERIVLGRVDKEVEAEHISRYLFASRFITGNTLDLGCGSGYGTNLLSKSKADLLIGLDINHDGILHGAKFYRNDKTDFIQAEASMLPFRDETFDNIVGFEVIEHVSNSSRMLSEMKRVMKYSGRVLLSSPNKLISSPISKRSFNPYHKTEWYISDFIELVQSDFQIDGIYAQCWKNKFLAPIRSILRHISSKYLHTRLLKERADRVDPKQYVITEYRPRVSQSPALVIVSGHRSPFSACELAE